MEGVAVSLPVGQSRTQKRRNTKDSDNLELFSDVLGFELLDPLDEVSLLQAPVAGLVPVVEDLLQVSDLQFLQVHALQVDLLVWKNKGT